MLTNSFLESHRAAVGSWIAASPQNAGIRVAADDLPSSKRRSVIAGDHAFDRMAHLAQFVDDLLGNSLLQTEQSRGRGRLDAESQSIERFLWLQLIIEQRHRHLHV